MDRSDDRDHLSRAASAAQRYLEMRRKRSALIGKNLFADPSWDMLLDLFVHQVNNGKVSVTSICFASGVPGTTALGHLKRLEEQGLVTREVDPSDGRRTFVILSPTTMRALLEWIIETLLPCA